MVVLLLAVTSMSQQNLASACLTDKDCSASFPSLSTICSCTDGLASTTCANSTSYPYNFKDGVCYQITKVSSGCGISGKIVLGETTAFQGNCGSGQACIGASATSVGSGTCYSGTVVGTGLTPSTSPPKPTTSKTPTTAKTPTTSKTSTPSPSSGSDQPTTSSADENPTSSTTGGLGGSSSSDGSSNHPFSASAVVVLVALSTMIPTFLSTLLI